MAAPKHRFYFFVMVILLFETVLSFGFLSSLSVLMVPIGTLLVVYIPGALCTDVLFPARTLKGYERAALSMSISAALALTIPPVLSYMGIAFLRSNLVITMDILVAALMAGSAWRTRAKPYKVTSELPRSYFLTGLGCLAVLGVSGLVVDRNLHNFQPSFYITDVQDKMTDYPYQITKDHSRIMELHVENPLTEALRAKVAAITASGHVLSSMSIKVPSGRSWSKPFSLPTGQLSEDDVIQFVLTVPSRPDLRRVLWIRYSVLPPKPKD